MSARNARLFATRAAIVTGVVACALLGAGRYSCLPALAVGSARAAQSSAQPDSIPDVELELRVEPEAPEVEFAQPFGVTIVRVWHKAFAVEDWSEDAFDPLDVKLIDTARRENETHVEETLRFECRSFEVGELQMPPPLLIGIDGDTGEQRIAFGDEWTLQVRSSLPEENPGAVEFPSGLLEAPFPWMRVAVRGGIVLAIVVVIVALSWRQITVRRRRREAAAEFARLHAPRSPYEIAATRLEALRAQDPSSAAEIEAYTIEASGLLRDYLRDGFAVIRPATTTQEFAAAVRDARQFDEPQRAFLDDFLTRCDGVKFGGRDFETEDRRRLLDAAKRFLDESRAATNGVSPSLSVVPATSSPVAPSTGTSATGTSATGRDDAREGRRS